MTTQVRCFCTIVTWRSISFQWSHMLWSAPTWCDYAATVRMSDVRKLGSQHCAAALWCPLGGLKLAPCTFALHACCFTQPHAAEDGFPHISYTYAHTYRHEYIQTYIHTYIHTNTYIHTYIHIGIYMCMYLKHIYIYT